MQRLSMHAEWDVFTTEEALQMSCQTMILHFTTFNK